MALSFHLSQHGASVTNTSCTPVLASTLPIMRRHVCERMLQDRRALQLCASVSDRNPEGNSNNPLKAKEKQSAVRLKASAIALQETAESSAWLATMPVVQQHAAVKPSQLTDGQCSFMEQHRIRGGEVGPDRQATILTMASLLQEAASNHVVALWGRTDTGFSSCPEMAENHQIFVVTRLQVQMDTYPLWGDVVQLSTWFQSDTRLSAIREWVLTDAATGAVFGRATSTWVVINMETRRLSKVPSSMQLVLNKFQPNPRRYAVPQGESKQKIPDIAEPFDIVGPVQVARRSDMDMNGHINNVTYLAWTLETVPKDVYNSGKLAQIELDYKHECQAGDTVESGAMKVAAQDITYTAGGQRVMQFVHVLRRCDENGCTELVRARTTWVLP